MNPTEEFQMTEETVTDVFKDQMKIYVPVAAVLIFIWILDRSSKKEKN